MGLFHVVWAVDTQRDGQRKLKKERKVIRERPELVSTLASEKSHVVQCEALLQSLFQLPIIIPNNTVVYYTTGSHAVFVICVAQNEQIYHKLLHLEIKV